MDILASIIEEYLVLYEYYVEKFSHAHFVELAINFEKHIKQWLLKVEYFYPLKEFI
jgi:hypothetical protein